MNHKSMLQSSVYFILLHTKTYKPITIITEKKTLKAQSLHVHELYPSIMRHHSNKYSTQIVKKH